MERILDLNENFDVALFEQIVEAALGSKSPNKNKAEEVLLRFKELPSSWTKIDTILNNSANKQTKFIALQILEEHVKSRWPIFNEEIKNGLRQYVYSTIIKLSSAQSTNNSDIVLKKFNSILVEIAKRDWPRKWPTFISDLISVSQTTSMEVSSNTLIILKNMNENLFSMEDEMTTTRRQLLKQALHEEYFAIFGFISLILDYSNTQELDDRLLENCLHAFKSFCSSMSQDYVFSTNIVECICGHLNSPHSLATLDCLLEIVELNNESASGASSQAPGNSAAVIKINHIHEELLGFFKKYLEKFDEGTKLSQVYSKLVEEERFFIRKYSKLFASLYTFWIEQLNETHTAQGLKFFVELSSIRDQQIFKDVFPAWELLINRCYSEYPLRVPTTRILQRNKYLPVLQSMLPVFVQNMPRPEEVFILINDLGEIVKDKKVETEEIEFYKKMRNNLFYLSFSIEPQMLGFFEKRMSTIISTNTAPKPGEALDTQFYNGLNQLCWSIGAIAGALEESVERNFFVSIIKSLLTLCEIRHSRAEKATIATNIMFVIGQFHRFLKFNSEFLFIVVKKLIEFMEEPDEDIKEMACNNFVKICEKCPNQFYQKTNSKYFIDILIEEIPSIAQYLEYFLQRSVIEGLFTVIKNGPKKDAFSVEKIIASLTNTNIIMKNEYLESICTAIDDQNQLKMTVHLIESYSIGFKILPDIFCKIAPVDNFLYLFEKLADKTNKNAISIKNALANLFTLAIKAGYAGDDFLNNICGRVLINYSLTFEASLLVLAAAVVNINNTEKLNEQEMKIEKDEGQPSSAFTASEIQRIQFIVNNLMLPSTNLIAKADENLDAAAEFLKLFISISGSSFAISFPMMMQNAAFESLMNSVLFSLTSLGDVSKYGLLCLLLIHRKCLSERIFVYFSKFYVSTLENLYGLMFDRDMKTSFNLQVQLLYEMIDSLAITPSFISEEGNVAAVKNYTINLLSRNFKNITQNALSIFVEGLFGIKNMDLLKEHISDFNVKLDEYGNDDDIELEVALLKERVSSGSR
ncbi:exportin-1 [Enteropsectra breve]|nr:exportin-1 [Enteropsectra breve]